MQREYYSSLLVNRSSVRDLPTAMLESSRSLPQSIPSVRLHSFPSQFEFNFGCRRALISTDYTGWLIKRTCCGVVVLLLLPEVNVTSERPSALANQGGGREGLTERDLPRAFLTG